MKFGILILVLTLTSLSAIAQCNIKINKRPDGTTVRYMNPEMVGKCNNCELGLSISNN